MSNLCSHKDSTHIFWKVQVDLSVYLPWLQPFGSHEAETIRPKQMWTVIQQNTLSTEIWISHNWQIIFHVTQSLIFFLGGWGFTVASRLAFILPTLLPQLPKCCVIGKCHHTCEWPVPYEMLSTFSQSIQCIFVKKELRHWHAPSRLPDDISSSANIWKQRSHS
jgi:hypothetical protein